MSFFLCLAFFIMKLGDRNVIREASRDKLFAIKNSQLKNFGKIDAFQASKEDKTLPSE